MPTKKSTKKVPTKKVSSKKSPVVSKKKTTVAKKVKSKPSTEKKLVQAKGVTAFWITDGTVLSNLIELRDAFQKMEKEVFSHHVNKDKNDFAEWVENVLNDADCASALRKSKTPTSSRTVVVRHLKVYKV